MPDAYNPWGAPVFPTADDNAMQPETFVPQGVRDWTQQAAPKDYNILSQIAGSLGKALMYPGQVAQSKEPISTEDMVAPAFNLASMLTLGAGAAPQEANALNMGIKAYHGSPHDFDKFDLSKVGTRTDGGGTTFGRGLYFADDPKAAKIYSGAEGKNYEVNINADPNELLQWHTAEQSPLAQKAIADLPSPKLGPEIPFGQDAKFVQDKNGSWVLDTGTTKFPMRQSDVDRLFGKEGEPLTGGQAYRRAASQIGEEEVANRLRSNGINGIRYPDEHRLSGSNYSILNPDIINIMRKYAVPGMLGAPILANALSEQKT